jgi:uncharacterized protein (DUF433 family)
MPTMTDSLAEVRRLPEREPLGSAWIGLRDNQNMAHAIVRCPQIMHGTPVIRGTRVPAQTLIDNIGGRETLEISSRGFPTVSRDPAVQAPEEAMHLLLARV